MSRSATGSDDTDDDASREQLLDKYFSMAKERKSKLSLKRKKKAGGAQTTSKKTNSTTELPEQAYITVSRMIHCPEKGRGILDKPHSETVKVYLHKEASYAVVLGKIKKELFGSPERDDCSYYIADNTGSPVCMESGYLCVQDADGRERTIPWTLKTHLAISKKYPSKLKLFCVQRSGAVQTSDRGSESDVSHAHTLPESAHENRPNPEVSIAESVVPFEPKFITVGKSLYRSQYWSRVGTQASVMESSTAKAIEDAASGVLDDIVCNPGKKVYGLNPCHLANVYLYGIGRNDEDLPDIDLVKEVSGEGTLVYNFPDHSAKFELWAGCYAQDGIALLVCVAINGFHPYTVYEWYKDGLKLGDETFPVLYATASGNYLCRLLGTSDMFVINECRTFLVQPGMMVVTQTDTPLPQSGCFLNTPTPSQGSNSDIISRHTIAALSDLPEKEVEVITVDNAELEEDYVIQSQPSHTDEHPKDTTSAFSNSDTETQVIDLIEALGDDGIGGLRCADEFETLKLGDVIGQGSFGTVYKAVWKGVVVAAKDINIEEGTRGYTKLIEEVEMTRMIQHPNIVRMIGVVQKPKSVCIITNYVNGSNLYTLIFGTAVSLSHKQKLAIAVQLTQAVAFLHSTKPSPLIHLDIKPANILVDSGNLHVYLADFGLAKIITSVGTVSTNTSVKGTPGFQAPELFKRSVKLDVKVDIYSTGCVMIELFSGHAVWEGFSLMQILYKVGVEAVSPSVDSVSPVNLKKMCEQCVSQDATQRPFANDVLHHLLVEYTSEAAYSP